MNTTVLNPLPSPTWRRLGVNGAGISLPEIPKEGWGEANSKVTLPDSAAPEVCPGFSPLESAAGGDLDKLLRDQAGHRLCLTVRGQTKTPVLIQHTLDTDHPCALSHVTLRALPGSRINLVEVIRGGVEGSVHGSLTEVQAGEGAQVTLIQLQMLDKKATSFSALAAEAGKDAKVDLVRAVLGGERVLCGGKCLLLGRASRFGANTCYYGDGNGVLDFSDTAIHTGKETGSEIHAAGVLDGACDKILRGTIDFRRGAVHGVGHESEDVLLLSPEVRNRTAPLILCGEEQVEGQHAASIGRLDDRMLYYMASRGVDQGEARRLLALAKFAPVLDVLPPDLRCEAEAFLEGRLGT